MSILWVEGGVISISVVVFEVVQEICCRRAETMEHDETGCQPPPEGPILCINNCGFFGSAATMNMCSKCHKDVMMKDQQAKLAASSIENIVNRSTCGSGKEPVLAASVNLQVDAVQAKAISLPLPLQASSSEESIEPKPKEGPSRCSTCKKRVGLTGFKCRCGNLFCGSHRYSDKHDCPFDYRTAGRDAMAKARINSTSPCANCDASLQGTSSKLTSYIPQQMSCYIHTFSMETWKGHLCKLNSYTS